ncbi:MAG: thiamine phosphate synthase [Burkholderiales bacterium]|nr:thiamine phosphate synthase [Burkholderiales bacterium]
MKPIIAGLYAITPDWDDTARLIVSVRAAIAGGARVVQYRNKKADAARRLEQALALAATCARDGATFIVNDHVELAQDVDADGVHLGAADGNLARARRLLGRDKRIGASCYDSKDLAHTALAAGADHVAFGSAFASPTKPSAVRAPHSLYTAAGALGVPVVAIGGITHTNASEVIAAGAHAVAVISDLFDAPDIRARAAQFSSLFDA